MSLGRFIDAQAAVYDIAYAELVAGNKRSHWMWFIFPQIAGLGRSATAQHYALRDLAEARAYRAHPMLGGRLIACTEAMLGWAGQRSAETILGGIDAIKLRSSMTLFEAASSDPSFAQCLDAFFAGERDPATLSILAEDVRRPI
jgi:uncharacterized protein (DUF1810 family)